MSPLARQIEEAIWRLDTAGVVALPQIDPSSWAGSVQLEMRMFGPGAALSCAAQGGSAERRVAAIMMVKDEADIIGLNLCWLYHQGVRRFVVTDNGSTDETRDALVAFRAARADAELVIVDDPLVSFVQSRKTTGMFRLAASLWADLEWVFPLDADEFLVAGRGFGALFELPGQIEAVTIPKVVHVRHRMGGEVETVLGRMGWRTPVFAVPPKSAVRASLDLTVGPGNHAIGRRDGEAPLYRGGLGLGLYCREFQTRSFEHLVRKVVNGGRAVRQARAEGRAEGGEHWLTWLDRLECHGEEGLREHYARECVREPDDGMVFDPFEGAPSG